MSKHGRILVAMSGGIDSSLAAVMLHEEGYEVIGMTMKTWDYASSGGTKKETGCCSLDSINDARNIAVNLGFPHYILDIREEFGDAVIDYFTGEYIEGRTPNPCVMCNTHIKWDALLRRADRLDCESIATGPLRPHPPRNRRGVGGPIYPLERGRYAERPVVCALGRVAGEFEPDEITTGAPAQIRHPQHGYRARLYGTGHQIGVVRNLFRAR